MSRSVKEDKAETIQLPTRSQSITITAVELPLPRESDHTISIKDASQHSTPFVPSWSIVLSMLTMSLITLMVALDASSLSVALPIMSTSLSSTAIQTFWAGTSFLLTETIAQPIIGSFSALFGRRLLVLVSVSFFAVGSLIPAVAMDGKILIAGRAVQGVGGGGIMTMAEIIVTDLIPLRQRGKWYAWLSAAWAAGTISGPLLGGGLATVGQWRWIFWINLPIIAVAVPMILGFLPRQERRANREGQRGVETKVKQIDWAGIALFTAATTGFTAPLSWGGVLYDWEDWQTILPIVICGLGLVGFVVHQEWAAKKGLPTMIRLAPLKSWTGAASYFGVFIQGIVLWCGLYYEPLYYEGVKGYSATMTGLALWPYSFTICPISLLTGLIIAYTGRYRWACWIGWVFTTVGCGLLALMQVDSSVPAWIFLNVPFGIGCGMLFASMNIAAQAAADPKDSAWAVILFAFFRALGNTFGVAAGGVVFQNRLYQVLVDSPSLADRALTYSKDAAGMVEVIKAMSDLDGEKLLLRQAYTDAFHSVAYMMCGLAALGLIASLATKEISLNQPLDGTSENRKPSVSMDEEICTTTKA